MVLQKFIKKFTNEIQDKYADEVRTMILFGSYARGESTENSDIDILVVWDGDRNEGAEKIEDIAYDYLLNKGLYFSVKVLSAEQYESLQEKESPFLKNVLQEGVLLVG
ncbi:MAG: nucleotidyltransferase family protein [Halanaerobiales bacterium]